MVSPNVVITFDFALISCACGQDEEDEEEGEEEEGGLSKSGKELKKLLGRNAGLNDSDAEDDDDDDDVHSQFFFLKEGKKLKIKKRGYYYFTCGILPINGPFVWFLVQMEDEVGLSPVLAPKQKDAPKEEPVDNSPSKPATATTGSARSTPSGSKSAKGKRKTNGDDTKATNGAPTKKVKTENVKFYFVFE